jgi:methylated-DNA-[protein]-cysteine S-methyltransferase
MIKIEQALREVPGYESESARAALDLAERAAGDGLVDVAYTTVDSPIGTVLVAATHRGLVRIAFGNLDLIDVVEELSARISPRVLEVPSFFDGVRRELSEYFEGRRTSFDLPLDWQLTRGFNRQVLRQTAAIPYGDVSTYSKVAAAAGSPRAYRAAGNALGSNPIPIVVPCHRVLHTGGGLGGYGGGLERKEFLLKLEGALTGEGPALPAGA